MVSIQPDTSTTNAGLLPMKINVQEAKPRTFAIRVGYDTIEELSGGLTWENRNFYGNAERLRGDLYGSSIRQTAEASYQLPLFLRYGQLLDFEARLSRDTPDAYISHNLRLGATVSRQMTPDLRLGLGAAYTWEQVKQENDRRVFNLISAPAFATWNTTSAISSKGRGGQHNLQAEPFFDLLRNQVFFKVHGQLSQIFRLIRSPLLTIGGRVNAGSITAASVDDIPADQRFYAGGPGSIRGYAYQIVGPLDSHNNPIGGRSFLTTALELTLQIYGPIGITGFIDGGSAYTQTMPNPTRQFLWGTGGGLSYFSPLGPVSIGIGFPLTRRLSEDKKSYVDKTYQFYVSIGYSF